MWKKVIALNLAIVLTFVFLPIQEIVAFAESLNMEYIMFCKNDGTDESNTVSIEHGLTTSRGDLITYRMIGVMPEYSQTDKRIVGYNTQPDGSGTNYELLDIIEKGTFSTDESTPTSLYAQWADAKDNSVLYLSSLGLSELGKSYYLQSGLSETVTLAEGNIFAEKDGKKVVGWQPLESHEVYFPGDKITITSNMTLIPVVGKNYFRLHYRNYSNEEIREIVIEDEDDYTWYANRLYYYEDDISIFGEYTHKFVGWNSKEDGTGEWYVTLNENTPRDLYAQYESYPDDPFYLVLSCSSGLASGKKSEFMLLDGAKPLETVVLPTSVLNGEKVAYWSRYNDFHYPAGEELILSHGGYELFPTIIGDNNQVGLIYGDGGKSGWLESKYQGVNYYLTSQGDMSIYSFDALELFEKENHVFVGYKGNKTGKLYDYYDDIAYALSNEKNGDISKFTAHYEPVEKGYIQYFGNGGVTSDKKGQYYEEIDFSNITTETYAENKFTHPDGENFLGWSTSREEPTKIYRPGEKIELTENTILYAQWGDNAVFEYGIGYFGDETVEFHRNVQTAKELGYFRDLYYGKSYFKGWNTEPNGTGQWFVLDDTIPNGIVLNLYEQREDILEYGFHYVISNVKQGDGTQLKIVPMEKQSATITIPDNTMHNYWYCSETQGNVEYSGFADESEYIYTSGEQIEISSGAEIFPFYAGMKITYNENFGNEDKQRVQYCLSSHGSLTIYDPEDVFTDIPNDRIFIGWNDSPNGSGEAYESNRSIYSKSVDLYAQWFTENSVINGTCGDNITWKLTGDGTLTISGTGEMDNNSSWDEDRFWNYLKPYIKSVVIEEGITYIGNYAFYECANLESVTIPKSINRIGYDAFYGCDNLKKANVSDVEAWCSIDFSWDREANPLSKCNELYLNGVLTTNITIPATVTSISNYAFYNCKWLEGITFEGDLSSVSWNTFNGCTNLKSIGVNKLETWINGAYYFEDCLTNNVWDLYVDGKLLEDLVIPETVTWMNSNKTFYNCKSIKSVTFHDEYYQISDNMFANCVNLSTINLSSSINRIGKNALYNTAFYNNESNWSEGMLCLGNHLVKVKENVSGEFSIPAKITSIAASAFEGTGVTKVYIHSNVNDMQGAFADALNLTSAEIASGATYIPYRAFYNCINLSEIIIPDSVYQISQDAFTNTAYYNDEDNWENDSLYIGKVLVAHRGDSTGVYTVKDGIKSIASTAFREKNYSSIILPESMIYIGDQAFHNCTNLTEMTLPENIDSLQWGLFYGCTSLKTVTLSENIKGMSNQVFTDCTALETIYNMPVSLNWFGTPIFTNCASLKDIYCDGTSAQWQKQYGNQNLGVDMSGVTVHCAGDDRPADACGKELTWSLSNDGVLTISGSGKMYDFEENATPWESVKEGIRELVIEEGVTKIGAYAFCHCPNLDTVRIPTTIKTIGNYAFENSDNSNDVDNVYITDLTKWCGIKFMNSRGNPLFGGTNLYLNDQLVKKLVIPGDVTELNNFAFLGCSSIEEIDIHKNVTNGYYYWFSCSNLKQINVALDNPAYTSIDGNLFSKDGSVLYQYSRGKGETQYTLPNTVTKINNEAFSGCNKLQTVILSNCLAEISYWAFSSCTSLKEITLPKTVTVIRQGAFSNCSSLMNVSYSGTDDEWNAITIEKENEPLTSAMSNASTARTKTIISTDGKTFTITPVNIENGKTVILALYDGNKLVEMQSAVYTGEAVPFTTTKSYTNAKVMVWDDITNLKPVCNVEIVK